MLLLLLLQGMEELKVTAVTSLAPSRSKSLSHGARYELMFEYAGDPIQGAQEGHDSI